MYNQRQQKIIEYTRTKVSNLFQAYSIPAHGIDHIARVAAMAKLIASKEKADVFLCEMSGWLHDIGRTLEGHTNLISDHAELSYELCRKWFRKDEVFSSELTKQQKLIILYAVRYHWNNFADKYDVAWILRDADKIDTFGLQGIKRGKEFSGGDEKKFQLDIRLRFDNFYWLHTKTAKKIVEQKGLIQQMEVFYRKLLQKKIKPVEL